MTETVSAQHLEVPGGRIAYDVAGPAEGYPIVLIHEAIADRRMWDREFARLSQKHRVVRYDLRGYGGSLPADSDFSSVEDLAALVHHLKLQRPLLVGASMGGRIALDFEVAHPGVAGGLLLVSPGFSGMDYPMFPEGVFAADDKASKAAYDAFSSGKLEEALEHLRGLWGAALTGANLEFFRTMVRENAPEVFLERSGQHERRSEPKASERFSTFRVPLVVLVGDRDNPAMPHVGRYLTTHVPNAQLRIVPGADHLLNLTAPQAFDAAVDEMVGKLPKSPRPSVAPSPGAAASAEAAIE